MLQVDVGSGVSQHPNNVPVAWNPNEKLSNVIFPNILNFTPGPQGWTSPLGVKFLPWEKCAPLCSPPGVITLYCLGRRMEGQTENFTPGITSPPRDKIYPWVPSLLGSKFAILTLRTYLNRMEFYKMSVWQDGIRQYVFL
jgi:hypothetical protein